jgi:nicotinamidase-related amidase
MFRWIIFDPATNSPPRFLNYNPHMTTLRNRVNTALLVVDVQNGVVKGAYERDAVVANVGMLVSRARQDRVPVIWVQHSDEQLLRGADSWQIVPELTPSSSEPLVEKNYGDAFENTNLETVLSDLGVGKLFVVGAQTDACIRSTLHGAFVRGYDVILVSDAHTTENRTARGAPPIARIEPVDRDLRNWRTNSASL